MLSDKKRIQLTRQLIRKGSFSVSAEHLSKRMSERWISIEDIISAAKNVKSVSVQSDRRVRLIGRDLDNNLIRVVAAEVTEGDETTIVITVVRE